MEKDNSDENIKATAYEMVDILLYVIHLANALDIDLSQVVLEKERINSKRFDKFK